MYNIFISYSAEDTSKVRPIVNWLNIIPDVRVFFDRDRLNPGDFIKQEIKNFIMGCDLFVVFYSLSAHSSQYVLQEIGVAEGNSKLIIPVLLDRTKPNAMLEGINYVNLSNPQMYNSEITRFCNHIIGSVQQKEIFLNEQHRKRLLCP